MPVYGKPSRWAQLLEQQELGAEEGATAGPPAFQASGPEAVVTSQGKRKFLFSWGSQIMTPHAQPSLGMLSTAETAAWLHTSGTTFF